MKNLQMCRRHLGGKGETRPTGQALLHGRSGQHQAGCPLPVAQGSARRQQGRRTFTARRVPPTGQLPTRRRLPGPRQRARRDHSVPDARGLCAQPLPSARGPRPSHRSRLKTSIVSSPNGRGKGDVTAPDGTPARGRRAPRTPPESRGGAVSSPRKKEHVQPRNQRDNLVPSAPQPPEGSRGRFP